MAAIPQEEDDDDFNSSDIEVPELQSPYASRGQASLELALALATCIAVHLEQSLMQHGGTIASVFHDLLQSGALTKDPRHQKVWITARMGHKVCESLALDVLQNGCRSWDIILQRLLSISLLIATAAPPGEIARSNLYTGPQYMTFGDVQVRLKTHGAQTEVLEASIALRWRRGDKDNSTTYSHILLESLPDEYSIVDPVKLLIIMALRTGNVAETTYDALLATTRQRKNRTIEWKDPKLPIIMRINASALSDTPTGITTLKKTLQIASHAAGMLQTPLTGDIRRGAAFETSKARSSTQSNSGLFNAQSFLGHINKAASLGITDTYASGQVEARTEARLTSNFDRLLRHPATFAPTAYRAPRLSRERVVNFASKHGMASSSDLKLRKAKAALKKYDFIEWAKENDPSQIDNVDLDSSEQLGPTNPSQRASTKKLKLGGHEKPRISFASDNNIDPALLELDQMLHSTPADGSFYTDDVQDDGNDASQDANQSLISAPCAQFIEYFASINQVAFAYTKKRFEDRAAALDRGGSRAEPRPFIHSCSNGFGFTTRERPKFVAHTLRCRGKPTRKAARERPHKCHHEGCEKSYAQKGDLTVHLKSHAYRPQPCNEDGCDPTIIYTTWSKMERHRNQKHSNWSPRTCSLCTGAAKDKPWLTRNEWRMHLTRKHKMTSEAIDEHLAATGEDLVVRESTSSKAESNNQLDLL